jgi:hypothetical protein
MTEQMTPPKNDDNTRKPLTVYELEGMIQELAHAHDEQQLQIERLKSLLAVHQHGKNGNALFPYEQ